MKVKRQLLHALLFTMFLPWVASGQDFKKWEAKIAEYKKWLEVVGSNGYRLWVRLDTSRRPHKLYVGEGFDQVDYRDKEQFVEIFSHYLAGHPEKFMLIDLFDWKTGTPIGEFGWGGFKLYANNGEAAKVKWPVRED